MSKIWALDMSKKKNLAAIRFEFRIPELMPKIDVCKSNNFEFRIIKRVVLKATNVN